MGWEVEATGPVGDDATMIFNFFVLFLLASRRFGGADAGCMPNGAGAQPDDLRKFALRKFAADRRQSIGANSNPDRLRAIQPFP